MSSQYDDMQGNPVDVQDHPAHDKPTATQHFAGDVLPMPGEKSMGSGPTYDSLDYALGSKSSPNVVPIGKGPLKSWAGSTQKRLGK